MPHLTLSVAISGQVYHRPIESLSVILLQLLTMGGSSSSEEQPKEETNVDTTNIGLWNMSVSGATYIGVGEILTIVVLVMVLLIIMKYCCKRMKVARRTELEVSIRNASRDSHGDVRDSRPEDDTNLKAALWIKSAGLV